MDKWCSKCRKFKKIEDFNKDRKQKDGHDRWCKKCRKVSSGKWYEKNKDAISIKGFEYYHNKGGKDIKRLWAQTNKDKVSKATHKYNQSFMGKITSKIRNKLFIENNPEKNKAHMIIHHAVESGKIPPAKSYICSRCHEKPAAHYHHPDYSKPLEVVSLCIQCHVDIHHKS